jgi:2-haloacid dehalogenase
VIVCDVNETLLDIGALAPLFEQAFGDGRVLQEWFQTVLLYSEVTTLAGPYSSFAQIGGAALEMTADARGVQLTPTARERILKGMLTLPPHAGLAELFEQSFSVESVQRFKPAPECYRFVAEALSVTTEQLRLVAAHAWDVLGALRAGCAAAFVARPGKVLFPLGPQPDIVGTDFGIVARKIIETEGVL